MTGRQRILAHLAGHPVDHLPVMPITMQFASHCIGAAYREYVLDYRVLVEAQLRVTESFGIDHVSCISDPAREAADCGAAVEFFPDQPPALIEERALLADKSRLASLKRPDPLAGARMLDRIQAIAQFKDRLAGERLIEGWIEGPCAQAADLRGINALMLDFHDDPAFVRDLLAFVVDLELAFARAQIAAGVDLIGIGDAAASLIGPRLYEGFVWPGQKRLVDGIHALGTPVRLHICGNTRFALAAMGRLGCEIVDLDYPSPLAEARSRMGPDQVLLGNIHPVAVVLEGTPNDVRNAVRECHLAAGPRYIVGAGCEIPRDTPPGNLRSLCEYGREHAP